MIPIAAGRHALLALQEDGRVLVRDLGTRNGTQVEGRTLPAGGEDLISAGELRARAHPGARRGRTNCTLPPERVFRRDLLRRHRTTLAISGLVLCLAFAVLSQWLAAPGSAAPRMLIAVLVTLACSASGWASGRWCARLASAPGRCAFTFPSRPSSSPSVPGATRCCRRFRTCCSGRVWPRAPARRCAAGSCQQPGCTCAMPRPIRWP